MGKFSKDRRDAYYRMAKEQGWRARSAFKLLQINDQFNLVGQRSGESDVFRVLDLCAAPGSWSQVLTRLCPPNSLIVAVDLQQMAPIEGVEIIRGDITSDSTANAIREKSSQNGEFVRFDLVVCDGAPDVTGLHDMDEQIQHCLLKSAIRICRDFLKPGGTFVGKIFRGRMCDLLYDLFRLDFGRVTIAKPRSSRVSSLEAFVVTQLFGQGRKSTGFPEFVICGGSNEIDSDTMYKLPNDYVPLDPTQKPIDPAYSVACQLKKMNLLDDKV